ncbi:hypothetical protein F5882DRAFT_462045 [Hyaloscypha sp. PMI_1271]|nr:hypothetical protein F5882DRAFT_462045 [Hyaloscypha sp. PMI_1271]
MKFSIITAIVLQAVISVAAPVAVAAPAELVKDATPNPALPPSPDYCVFGC